jgi:glutamate dehydrogenase (NADP+)
MPTTSEIQTRIDEFNTGIRERNPAEYEFHQAVQEFTESVMPFMLSHPIYKDGHILERMTEPDRIVIFRVCWENDDKHICCNRAWRVQFNNAIGPYKGGLRFHPNVTQSVLKFLGFEQVYKNALTGLPMGGGKGGSNFDPKGKSDREVMRFCQSMMTELSRHIGEDTDIPAGDIGVGAREISYLFGQYKRLQNRFTGVLTGKGLAFGGSLIRTEATGYGVVYFTRDMLAQRKDSLQGKKALISGSGNVALYCAEKLLEEGAKVLTLSDSSGFVCDPEGIDKSKLAWVMELKNQRRGRISEYVEEYSGSTFYTDQRPWSIEADIAFPCATQNELNEADARLLVSNGIQLVAEGANMPSTLEAVHYLRDAGVLFAPAKAANAGGVAVSGLEQSQNAMRIPWTREDVDHRLQEIMTHIHQQCVDYGNSGDGHIDYVTGANIAGFVKVADAMLAYGIA